MLALPIADCDPADRPVHANAKTEAEYRFYALYEKIRCDDILAHAYTECRSNKGAPGVDGQDFADVEAYGSSVGLVNWRLPRGLGNCIVTTAR